MLLNILIKTSLPGWFYVLCILAGAMYSGILYYRSHFIQGKSFISYPNILLAILRFLSVTAISFFLLSPFVNKLFLRIEKPVIVIALDNSKSIVMTKDSDYYKTKFTSDIDRMIKALNKKYEVQVFNFGNFVEKGGKLDFSKTRTNISEMLENISGQNFNRNIGAFILASDGIFNEGKDPLPVTAEFRTKFYTVAMGDTALRKDVYVKDVNYNSIAYQGNMFIVRAKIGARKFNNSSVNVAVIHNNQVVGQKKLDINNDQFLSNLDFEIEAKDKGIQQYTISVTRLNGDINYTNNTRNIYVEVLESKKKILILAFSPHPDVFAIKRSIEKNDNYSVTSKLISDFRKNNAETTKLLAGYDVIFVHQLPALNYPANEVFEAAEKLKIPLFIIIGAQTSLGQFNSYNTGLNITQKRSTFNTIYPEFSATFNYFNFSDNLRNIFSQLPPLTAPFADYKLNSDNQVALYQRIGKITSNYPLLVFIDNIDTRIAVLCGEGIWRWPLYEYSINQEQSAFDELINKSVQFLSLKADKRFFRLKNQKTFFYEDEPVTFDAEVFNQSYEKMENAKIKMLITGSDNKVYEYYFRETENDYKLNAGFLVPGNYYFNASVFLNGKENKISGSFMVKAVDVEYINTVADHKMLYAMAVNNFGKMFYPDQISQLTEALNRQKDIKPISHFDQDIRDLIEIRWLFFFILVLLSAEWFFRKFYGDY